MLLARGLFYFELSLIIFILASLFFTTLRSEDAEPAYSSDNVDAVMILLSLSSAISFSPNVTPFAAAEASASHIAIAADAEPEAAISGIVKNLWSFFVFEEYTMRNILYIASIIYEETAFIIVLLPVFWISEKRTLSELTMSFLLKAAIILPPAAILPEFESCSGISS